MRKDKRDTKDAKMRHLKRAFAGIDRTQRQRENFVFKTVTREVAQTNYEKVPQGQEVGKYNPMALENKQPCFVRIQNEKAEKEDHAKPKEPSLQYSKEARCQSFVPHP
mmetsp:Transcript_28764/g.43438  ORF Transcript_28764/g.43438 Transcript_28764/m.43438 type:complete len:108 (+) Transcript_28764:322-645(+)